MQIAEMPHPSLGGCVVTRRLEMNEVLEREGGTDFIRLLLPTGDRVSRENLLPLAPGQNEETIL